MKQILVSRDNKNKCRVVQIETAWVEDHYEIYRKSGLLNGKMTPGPTIVVKPKVKRNHEEQCELEFNSHVKKYLDKGYKTIQSLGHETLETFTEKDLPEVNTNQNGVKKPMLCKVYDPDDSKSQNIKWLASKKLDGVRAFIYMRDGKLYTASRGGQDYDIAATYILQDEYLNALFEKYPNLILDGEIYKHGWNLQKISGLCRLEELHEDHKQLKFHCYDIVDETKPFKERLIFLQSLIPLANSKLVILDHVNVEGNESINELHDKWVAEGYEGLVLRDPDQPYKCGGRDRRMQKVKRFTDAEFKVIGFSEGRREEDFVFKCITNDGKEFEAKPIGDRELKKWYREHMEELIGQKATIKYFNITPDGKPNLPVLKSFVNKKDR